jgi:hypothetical protein
VAVERDDHRVHRLVAAGQLGLQQGAGLGALIGRRLEDHDHVEPSRVQGAQPARGAAQPAGGVGFGEHLAGPLPSLCPFQPPLADEREDLSLRPPRTSRSPSRTGSSAATPSARRHHLGAGAGAGHRDRPLFGPPSGRPIDITVVDIARIIDGRIVEHWGVPDRFALLAQTGALSRLS